MTEPSHHDLELAGCTPEPLMAYLKALGILRLVSEQADAAARGWWKDDVFWLRSTLDGDALVRFFLEDYSPTPIVVPWSGGDFFDVDWKASDASYKKTPTASKVIEAVLATRTPRFEPYRRALHACKTALDKCGIDTKEKMGKQKWTFIREFRSACGESLLVDWIDAAAVSTVERFAALLGSGGGSDGNTHFSDNFMQNLWDVAHDFDNQRKPTRGRPDPSIIDTSRDLLLAALTGKVTNQLIEKRTSSLYDSGSVGGANATQGLERPSLTNPWNMILAFEGTISFAGATTKRLATNAANDGAFPFQVSASITIQDGLADKERAGKEVWLPLWARRARSDEVLALLREGRAQCGPRRARDGVDMARAVSALGVDRGIEAFGRFAILKGRVGGDNYNTAAALGRFEVAPRQHVDLLREVDPWLNAFRRASGDKHAPPRFGSALRRIDSAIFGFCKYGGESLFREIVVALGAAERAVAAAERFREAKELRPLAGLSTAWIEAANDRSEEFAIARALASIHDPETKIGSLRRNLEPIVVGWRKAGETYAKWAEKDRAVVWNAADLAANMANVLQRRMLDGARTGCDRLPMAARFAVGLDAVGAFLGGELNDDSIEELIWGLMLIDDHGSRGGGYQVSVGVPLPRAYALLKMLFLPQPVVIEPGVRETISVRLLQGNERGGIVIRPEPSILHLLRSGRLGEACEIGTRRLRASGLDPMPGPIHGRGLRDRDWRELDDMGSAGVDSRRLAAALLIPVGGDAVGRLVRLVIRGDDMFEAAGPHSEGGRLS